MTDLEALVAEMGAGLKLVTGMLALTVALLPIADRDMVLDALAALRSEKLLTGDTDRAQVATKSEAEVAKGLSAMIEKFAAELEANRKTSIAEASEHPS